MGIFERLSSWLGIGGGTEFRALLAEPVEKFEWVDNVGNTTSGLANLFGSGRGQSRSAVQASYTMVPTIRKTVGTIAETFAAVQWRLLVSSSSPSGLRMARRLRAMKASNAEELEERHKLIEKAVEDGDLREVEAHPYLEILEKANMAMTGLTFRELTQIYLDLVGESFWEIQYSEGGVDGVPVALWPINPAKVLNTPMAGDPNGIFKVQTENGQQREIPASKMVWMRKINPNDPYGRGRGIAQTLADEIDADEQAAKQIISFFANNSIPSAVVNLGGAGVEAVKVAKADWETQHGGARSANKIHFTNAPNMSVQELSAAFKDSQMLELREFENKILRETFGVPPEIVGNVENSNRATIWGSESIMAKFVLVPRLEFQRTEQQTWLLPLYPGGERLVLDYDSPLPPDQELQTQKMENHPYAFSINQIRASAGLEPLEGDAGAAHFVPISGTLVRADELLDDDVDEAAEDEEEDPAADEPVDNVDDEVEAEEDVERAAEGRERLGKSTTSKTFGFDPVAAADGQMLVGDLTDHTNPVMERLVEEWGQDAIDVLGVGMVFNVGSQAVVDHLREQAGRMLEVNETSRRLMAESLAEGVGKGEGIPALRGRVNAVFADFSKRRSEVIARTEVIRSANFARFRGFAQTGIVKKKRWLATRDLKTRPTHRKLGTQKPIDLHARFVSSSGASALYPGGFGVPAEDIQCRCVMLPVVDDKQTADERIQDRIEVAYDTWEKIFAIALDNGFAAQRSAVLRVFE